MQVNKKTILFFLSVFFSFLSLMAQEGLIEMSGQVRGPGGKALEGASVEIVVNGKSQFLNTDAEGMYRTSLAPNTYTVKASYAGFAQKTATLVLDAKNHIFHFNLQLPADLEEVSVLGSRAAPRTAINTPVPVDIIDLKKIAGSLPQMNLNQILNVTAPSFTSTPQAIADGTDHIDPATLRGLGPEHTLVLINGKRRYQTALVNVNGSIGRGGVGTDLNAIPVSAIDKLEILRDGAAAQYGSDAIAGVINVILKRNTNKLTSSVTYGANVTDFQSYTYDKRGDFTQGINPTYKTTSIVDGQSMQVAANYGIDLGKKGGFINFSGTFDSREATNRAGEQLATTIAPASYNTDALRDVFLASIKGTRDDYKMRTGQAQLRGGQFMYNMELPLNRPATSVYSFGSFGYRDGNSGGFYRLPYAASNSLALYPFGFLPIINTNIYDQSLAVGIKTEFKGWNVDLSTTYGQNKNTFMVRNSANVSQQTISRTILFNAGTLSFAQSTSNLDISRKINEALNLAFGSEFRYENYQQVAGEEASWANYQRGFLVGGVFTQDIYKGNYVNSIPLATGVGGVPAGGAQVFPGFRPDNAVDANRNSFAFYADVEYTPLKALLIDGAVRYEKYSDFGDNFSGKLAARYKVTEQIALRASASTGFRAPSLQQRYINKTSTVFIGGLPYDAATLPNTSQAAALLGIPSLKPELSQSVSVGATANVSGVKITVDGYYTTITDRMILTDNFQGSSTAAVGTTLRTISDILTLNNANQANFIVNAIDTKNYGVDAVVSYSTRLAYNNMLRMDLSGSMTNIDITGEHYSDLLSTYKHTYLSPANKAYVVESFPKQKVNLMLNDVFGKWSGMLKFSYVGQVKAVLSYADLTVGGVKLPYYYEQILAAKVLTDLSVSYSLSKMLKFTVGVNNIFDVYPDLLSAEKGKFYSLQTDATKSDYNQIGVSLTAKDLGVKNNDVITSNNQINYSRSATQIGMNGRFVFARVEITL